MKSQILKAKNAKGGNMKAYTIVDYSNGDPKPSQVRNLGYWASLTTCNSQLQSHARITETFYNNWNSRKRNHA